MRHCGRKGGQNEKKLRAHLHRISPHSPSQECAIRRENRRRRLESSSGALMLDLDEVRAAFPYLARCVYLNTAAAGLSWAGQGKAAAEFYDSAKATGIGGETAWAQKVTAAKHELAHL